MYACKESPCLYENISSNKNLMIFGLSHFYFFLFLQHKTRPSKFKYKKGIIDNQKNRNLRCDILLGKLTSTKHALYLKVRKYCASQTLLRNDSLLWTPFRHINWRSNNSKQRPNIRTWPTYSISYSHNFLLGLLTASRTLSSCMTINVPKF